MTSIASKVKVFALLYRLLVKINSTLKSTIDESHTHFNIISVKSLAI